MAAHPQGLDLSLKKLSLKKGHPPASLASEEDQAVLDSWEDEDLSSGGEADRATPSRQSAGYPSAPPPTPISTSTSFSNNDEFITPYGYGPDVASGPRNERSSARPDKTDAVAQRMIAGALGVKVPKRTDEQRAYDRAIKEKEMKRRNREKERAAQAKEEAERAKAAVWSD